MFVICYNPETEEIYMSRRLVPHEIMDLDEFAKQTAESLGVTLAPSSGAIPNCCGDIRIEFRPYKKKSWHIWSGKSYYLSNTILTKEKHE